MDTMTCAVIGLDVNSGDVLKWGIILMCGVLVLGTVMLVARRYYRKAMAGEEHPGAFPVENLRQMRDSDQISDEEFSSLRRTALSLGSKDDEKIDNKSSTDAKRDDEGGNVQKA